MGEENSEVKSADLRLDIDLFGTQPQILEKMKSDCGMETDQEIFSAALALFKWAADETRKGRKLGSYDPETDDLMGIHVPALSKLAPQ